MTHFVISALGGSDPFANIVAFSNLPPRWSKGKHTFSVISDCNLEVHNGLSVSNADVLIHHNHDTTFFEIGSKVSHNLFHTRVDFVRQKKSIQTAIFNTYAQKLKLKNYRHLNAWDNLTKATVAKDSLFIARPENAARGIGQLICDSNEITPYGVMALLKGDTNKSCNEAEHHADFLKELKERAPSAVYSSERERSVGEGFHQLITSPCISEYVLNVNHEWRLITGADGKVCYIIKRERKVTGEIKGIQTAIGCGNRESLQNVGYCLFDTGELNSSIISEITKMLEALHAPLQSFDLYTTTDHKWGFFETSPEFGREAVPSQMAQEEGKKFLENLCEARSKL